VSWPIQYGLDADNAKKWGMYALKALAMAMAFSAERTPTCTWMPKICRRRATHCISSTRRS